jgi:putative transposase
VQAIHAKIVNTRKDFLHKETTKIADTFGLVCVGDISGRWLQATNGKSSADASTGMSRNMLRYKAIARRATFVDVPEYLKHSDLFRLRCGRRP